jgi:hypothetical protein
MLESPVDRVWHEGLWDLIPTCLGTPYLRHDEKGTRSVMPEAYALEVAAAQRDRSNTRFVVHDHDFAGDRPWCRFTLTWKRRHHGGD